ncbi:putative secreted protein [Rhodopirellula sp. SWK7]|nr:putative secreted protein [Rhodopirellula sp. SWK7]
MTPSRLTLLACNLAVLVVFASASISTCDADDPKPTAQSIIEQRRAIMRGEAAGRTKVEVRKSSKADLEKGEISFDDLKFDIEKDEAFAPEKLTETLRFLNGRKVKLSGYILPSTLFKETDIDQFVLVRDNLECCFGPGAALFDCVMVEMVPGKTTDFVTRPVTVEGKFVFDPNKYKYPPGVGPNGASHFAIFRIEGIQVR